MVNKITVAQGNINIRCSITNQADLSWLISALEAARETALPQSSRYDVILVAPGERFITVIKEVRALTGWTLKDAKSASETPGAVIMAGVTNDAAHAASVVLQGHGATVGVQIASGGLAFADQSAMRVGA